ncbi:MAG: class I SAM-dependent methyltransferase [Actinomycetota bacterium]|nr:class I SAM-dependent methyltransferase [Actinomycetota bacterium]
MRDYKVKYYYNGSVACTYLKDRVNEVKWQLEQSIVRDLVDRYMKKGEIVLDVPFGTGRFAYYYIKRGLKIYGLDISNDMLNEARKYLGNYSSSVNFINADAEKIPLSNNSVDYLVCVRLLNWIPIEDIEKFLLEFKRVTRSKIILHIRVRNFSGSLWRGIKTLKREPVFFIKDLVKYIFKKLFNIHIKHNERGKKKLPEHSLIIHGKKQIFELLSKLELNIVEEITVEEYGSNPKWIFCPLQFYVLTKNIEK